MDNFTKGYMETALWSSNDNSNERGGSPLDENYGVGDIAPQSIQKMEQDCAKFQTECSELLKMFYSFGYDEFHGGHNFWLNRNGHGAGFWDREGDKKILDALSNACERFGEEDLYIGDDNLIHVMSEHKIASAKKASMTAQDYKLLASAITETKAAGGDLGAFVDLLATKLKENNARFDRDHFMAVVNGNKTLNSRPGSKAKEPINITEEEMQGLGDRAHQRVQQQTQQDSAQFNKNIVMPGDKKRGARMAGAKMADGLTPELIAQAKELIEADDQIIYDVADDRGQIVDNVKHMSWFVQSVAQWLADDPSYYAEAMQRTQGAAPVEDEFEHISSKEEDKDEDDDEWEHVASKKSEDKEEREKIIEEMDPDHEDEEDPDEIELHDKDKD